MPFYSSRNTARTLPAPSARPENPNCADGTGISHYLEVSHVPLANELLSLTLCRKKFHQPWNQRHKLQCLGASTATPGSGSSHLAHSWKAQLQQQVTNLSGRAGEKRNQRERQNQRSNDFGENQRHRKGQNPKLPAQKSFLRAVFWIWVWVSMSWSPLQHPKVLLLEKICWWSRGELSGTTLRGVCEGGTPWNPSTGDCCSQGAEDTWSLHTENSSGVSSGLVLQEFLHHSQRKSHLCPGIMPATPQTGEMRRLNDSKVFLYFLRWEKPISSVTLYDTATMLFNHPGEILCSLI